MSTRWLGLPAGLVPRAMLACVLLPGPSLCLADGIRPIGEPIQLTSGGSWWNTVCYNPDADQYLVIWQQYGGPHVVQKGRCIDAATGAFAGPEFQIAEWIGLGGVVYNPDLQCWFVVYFNDHDVGGDIFGQKVGTNGPIGSAIPLVTADRDQTDSAVAYDPLNRRYLVAWTDYRGDARNVRGRFFDMHGSPIPGSGERQLSDYTIKSQSGPVMAYNPAVREFLVLWTDLRNDIYRVNPDENNNNYTDIYGQRVDAGTGALVGDDIPILTPYVPGQPYVGDGWDGPGGLVCNPNPADPMYGTYFLGIQKLTGLGWTTRGLILNADGSHYGPVFDVSHPLRGGYTGAVYDPSDGTYFVSFLDVDYDCAARQYTTTGQAIRGSTKIVAHREYEENFGGLAVRPRDGQYLQTTTWFENLITHQRPYILVAQRFIRDTTPPGPAAGLVAGPGRHCIRLSWANPSDADFAATKIVYGTTGYPTSPADGLGLVNRLNSPGSADSYVHDGLAPGAVYYYSAFAHDGLSNYAPGIHAAAVPWHMGDLDGDLDADQEDFGRLQACFSGSGQLHASGCEDGDFDGDRDVDPDDLVVFQACVGGAHRPPAGVRNQPRLTGQDGPPTERVTVFRRSSGTRFEAGAP